MQEELLSKSAVMGLSSQSWASYLRQKRQDIGEMTRISLRADSPDRGRRVMLRIYRKRVEQAACVAASSQERQLIPTLECKIPSFDAKTVSHSVKLPTTSDDE